jgi:hypothetical protein
MIPSERWAISHPHSLNRYLTYHEQARITRNNLEGEVECVSDTACVFFVPRDNNYHGTKNLGAFLTPDGGEEVTLPD